MKKLNRKGFTLIELLAVVVILAIVLVVTIPSVLRSVGNARTQSLENAANSVSDWLTRQYELAGLADTNITTDTVDGNFSNLTSDSRWANATSYDNAIAFSSLGTDGKAGDSLLKAAGFGGGLTDANGKVWRSGNKICVELTAEDEGRLKGTGTKRTSGC